jgi:hypothetical protein
MRLVPSRSWRSLAQGVLERGGERLPNKPLLTDGPRSLAPRGSAARGRAADRWADERKG